MIAELYRKRWTIETAFQELEETLQSEIQHLGLSQGGLVCVLCRLGRVQHRQAPSKRPGAFASTALAVVDTEFSTYDHV